MNPRIETIIAESREMLEDLPAVQELRRVAPDVPDELRRDACGQVFHVIDLALHPKNTMRIPGKSDVHDIHEATLGFLGLVKTIASQP